jgi:hypothetical protein
VCAVHPNICGSNEVGVVESWVAFSNSLRADASMLIDFPFDPNKEVVNNPNHCGSSLHQAAGKQADGCS